MGKTRAARQRVLGLPIVLAALTADAGDGPVWVQVAAENKYLGHPAAKKLDWDRAFFETLVANFRRHPWYSPGPDGIGVKKVIPYDYEHVSEMDPRAGSIPLTGTPAAGWIFELEVRDGEGGAELWALSSFRDDVREQIRAGGYATTSVAVDPNFVDPVSAEKLGPTLTSVALTNKPFIQGMEPIAATMDQWGPAETPEEALVGLRKIFELVDDAPPEAVIEQIQAFRGAIAGGTVPDHVDTKWLLEQLRRLLSLGLMSSLEDILGGAEAAARGTVPQGSDPPAGQGEPTMAGMLTALAAILCCADSENAVITAAKETKAAADKAEDASEALDSLGKLKSLFGSSDMQDLIAKATKTIADAEALKPTLEALSAAQAALKSGAEADAENEAEAVAASLANGDESLKARFKPVVLSARVACIKDDGTLDETKLAKFREDYPLEEEQRALLSRRVVAGPNGQQLGGAVTGYRTESITASAQVAGLSRLVDEINAQPGRNPIEKTNALLLSRRPAHKDLPWPEQCRVAGEISQQVMDGKMPVI